MHEIDLEQANRAEIRWRILKSLDAGRPLPVAETVILDVLQNIELPVSPHGLRRELQFLRESNLVMLDQQDQPTWIARLTALGINVVEYNAPVPDGIRRPRKWY